MLFRGLESSVSEDLLAKGAAKLFRTDEVQGFDGDTYAKPGVNKIASTSAVAQAGAQPGTIRRVLLIKDRRSGDSWRYGFVEYMTVEVCCYPSSQVVPVIATDQEKDAQAALAKFNALERFTISSKPVLVSYVHAGIFVPELDAAAASEGVTFAASTNPSLQLKYWDEDAFVSELVVSTETTGRGDTAGLTSKTLSKGEGKSKKRKAENSSIETSKKVCRIKSLSIFGFNTDLERLCRRHYNFGPTGTPSSTALRGLHRIQALITVILLHQHHRFRPSQRQPRRRLPGPSLILSRIAAICVLANSRVLPKPTSTNV